MPEKRIHFQNPRVLSQLYCDDENNLALVENTLQVKLVTRDGSLKIEGPSDAIQNTETLFETLRNGRSQGLTIRNTDFQNMVKAIASGNGQEIQDLFTKPVTIQIRNRSIVPRTINQKKYVQSMSETEIVFGIGPAGTGKTYLAMATAIDALLKEEVEKLILTRPAVEAGEALGFLPGDLQEKIQPYLRPLYDAMNDIIGHELSQKLLERGVIEIAPLAYMRGRTLSNAFIILDEAQNTTPEQMMMFLTRMGDRSRTVVTGDITQIDLPQQKHSGLKQAIHVLGGIPGITFLYLHKSDVVRHPLVQEIIEAYADYSQSDQS
ncbi:MAG: PhoH-like protein [Candidatus Moanabacter tarae]|uniref:PhoH-like protein n=1 Tax=Candidatus Moanibacter tarae TaxID=2200854 RepID=A0A2Z4ABY0_9BACT|nr:MAG: PhoH-like protein [Candidatus Moanabacter tarae]|tara:strand:- start:17235 stop:18197 length:963 start_codon:yes stop_codon:yes gene_type:complete